MNEKVNIRKATAFDHSAILNLSVQWFEEVRVQGFPGVCAQTGVWLADLIANHLFLVGEYGDKIIGALGLRIGNVPWNVTEPVLFNELFMTDKDYRGTGISDRLIDAVKEFSEDNNLLLIMGHMTGTDAHLKDKYLSIKGFSYAGANFIFGRK